jgi:hypothetical protein
MKIEKSAEKVFIPVTIKVTVQREKETKDLLEDLLTLSVEPEMTMSNTTRSLFTDLYNLLKEEK